MFTRKFTRMLYRVRENFIFSTSDRQFIGIVCFIIYLLYYIILYFHSNIDKNITSI